MSEVNRVEIDEQLRSDARICKEGVETDFWKLIKRIYGDLQDQAGKELFKVDPSDIGAISKLQATFKAVDELIGVVEDTARLT